MSIADDISDRLRSNILQGRIKPGTRLRLGDFRAEFGVSWSPIREGLSRLVAEGLVVPEVPRGYRVAAVSRAHYADVLRNRIRVECIALRDSIERGDDAWEAELLAAYHRLSKFEARSWQPGDFEQWEIWHRNYHQKLIAACGSPILLQFCSMLHDQRDRYRSLFLAKSEPNRNVAREHGEITQAVLARDAERAAALLERHIERNGTTILSAIPA